MEKQTLVVEFDDFKIGRVVSVSVNDPVQSQLLPSAPYQRTNARNRYQDSQLVQTAVWVVPGRQTTRYIKICYYNMTVLESYGRRLQLCFDMFI